MSLDWLTPDRRKWIYSLTGPTLALLITYGILDEATAALWAALVGAVLVPSMAAAFTGRPYGKHAADDE